MNTEVRTYNQNTVMMQASTSSIFISIYIYLSQLICLLYGRKLFSNYYFNLFIEMEWQYRQDSWQMEMPNWLQQFIWPIIFQRVDRNKLEHFVSDCINIFSLEQVNSLIQLALEFGHNYEDFRLEQSGGLESLKAQPLPNFKKDRWCGKPDIIDQRYIKQQEHLQIQQQNLFSHQYRSTIYESELIINSNKGKKNIMQKNDGKSKKSLENGKFIKLPEYFDTDPKTDKLRQKKKQQCLKQQNMEQQKEEQVSRPQIRNIKKLPSKYTYDYDGSKLYCKQQIIRKNLQNLFQIEHKQMEDDLKSFPVGSSQMDTKQSNPAFKKKTSPAIVLNNSNFLQINNQQSFLNKADPNQRMKECLEDIVLQKGVWLQDLKTGPENDNIATNQDQVSNQKISYKIGVTQSSDILSNTLLLIGNVGSKNIPMGNMFKSNKKKKPQSTNQIHILSQQWKSDILKRLVKASQTNKRFKASISKDKQVNSIVKQSGTMTPKVLMDPINKYDVNILSSQKWGGNFNGPKQNKLLIKMPNKDQVGKSSHFGEGQKPRQRSRQNVQRQNGKGQSHLRQYSQGLFRG